MKPVLWSTSELASMQGKSAVITGATSGIGLKVTELLVQAGVHVVAGVRDTNKGYQIRDEMLGGSPLLSIEELDIAELDSVRSFATRLHDSGRSVDALLNNAGIANRPRTLNSAGIEMQFATNYLGHFALTGFLFPLLEKARSGRVVSVGSGMYRGPNALHSRT